MQFVNLGRSGLKVSRICLGAMSYGSPASRPWIPEEEGRPFIRRALELGINFFDTADMYSEGASEEVLARRCATSRRAARWSSRPSSTTRWATGRTTAGCRASTS